MRLPFQFLDFLLEIRYFQIARRRWPAVPALPVLALPGPALPAMRRLSLPRQWSA